MKKRILCTALIAILLCTVCLPFSAFAAPAHNHTHYISYISRSEDGTAVESFGLFCETCDEVVHVKTKSVVVDYRISYNGWGANGKTMWYFVDGLVSLKDPVRIYGTVNLVLLDDALLICEGGIHLYDGASLNIYSEHLDYSPDTPENHMGRLRAYARGDTNHCAAIGGVDNGKGDTVSIYGGDIYAFSEGYGAAIGSGYGGSITVNICGGKVRAVSTDSGAAIGGGYNETNATVNFRGGIAWAKYTDNYAASVGRGFWECHATVNFSGGYVYGVPNAIGTVRTDGITADSIKREGSIRSIGKNDGLYDEAGMKLAEKAGWIAQNGGYVGSVLSDGNLWILIGVAVLAVGGVTAAVIVSKKKKKIAPQPVSEK